MGWLRREALRQRAQVRAKAMRALAAAIKAQPDLLGRALMRRCIGDAISSDREDSAQVGRALLKHTE